MALELAGAWAGLSVFIVLVTLLGKTVFPITIVLTGLTSYIDALTTPKEGTELSISGMSKKYEAAKKHYG